MDDFVGYPVSDAKLDLRQTTFDSNRKAWEPVLQKYNQAMRYVSSEGDEASQRRHQVRGQLLGMLLSTLFHSTAALIVRQQEIE